ncbi:tryptophan-rich sensory protein [Nocardia yunnanensis]|uniref:Tryptophan-rich sensory protein n=1 Tax=Nocardia yunnanensis TaxID=2382165 RepID=A0A386ZNK3_9NOCA|nr:TspO/MBR family protein [Nocardia yunnanensis]AYF79018.1 tryptophan-rich sensory protein [Nocardia yunnanensis]
MKTTAVPVAAAAVVGSLAAGPGSRWYRRLNKPAFQPPSAVFPIVWTLLYADIAVCTAGALDRAPNPATRQALRRALLIDAALNSGWSWVFFRAHRLGPAVALAAALTLSSADLTRRTTQLDARARALAVYPAWCAFATVLSNSIRRRNRA